MEPRLAEREESLAEGQAPLPLGLGWSAELQRGERGALLRLQHPQQGMVTVEIALTARGPVIRASAAALEIDTPGEVFARCERFTVEARQNVTLRAPEILHQASGAMRVEGKTVEIDAVTGGVRMHANDDVQLLGERVLLNCEREAPLPSWLPPGPGPTLPAETVSGDASLFDGSRDE